MNPLPVRRIGTGILALWLGIFAAWSGPVSANTSDSAPISINIMSDGKRQISWTNSPVTFLHQGHVPTLNATTPFVVAEATLTLEVSDSLPDGARPGYTIAISAGTFTAEDVSTTISPATLSIVAITPHASDPPLPDGYLASFVTNPALDSSVTILTVPNGAGAVDATITIKIGMTLTPGLMAGTYSGSITADLLPLPANAP